MINFEQFSRYINPIIRNVRFKATEVCQPGFTIIESLMAIIVVAILLSATAPAILISVGNRVQAKRIESATQAARAYIDGVRSGAIEVPKQVIVLNEVNTTSKTFDSKRGNFSGVNAPTSSLSCNSPINGYCSNTTTSSLYCINRDQNAGCANNNGKDLIIQAFRSTTDTTIDDSEKGYLIGIRVYRADAFNGTVLKTKKANDAKTSSVGGAGAALSSRQVPLIEMTTEIASKTTQYQDYCERFGGCQQ
ncbi:hormogonium polysaccharide secretion pseudopilin HpsB [Calothrix sp. UHCC 0171]|uniref:hormogonium polysaccharide secretion pseudopilin HpsB n=1 Tax=Calothrix sp. UHCC 0171 TaxID=3110245 RepID=UPI002B201457|nr:hormogonium polysaccharide secretion pseudopilin HpsB [Calothrix sp. UHCC 0171]MEA5569496.1 hormogonium polysaccharide secretion pseudopilin HpsB [Calothrix sp. UHCC 0171]